MAFVPYMIFNGNCAEALEFYAEVFGGEAQIVQKVAQSPMAEQFDDSQQGFVMHGQVQLGDRVIAIRQPYGGLHPTIRLSHPDDLCRPRLRQARIRPSGQKGRNAVEFATHFSPGFGLCTDRYGVPWMVMCEGDTAAH